MRQQDKATQTVRPDDHDAVEVLEARTTAAGGASPSFTRPAIYQRESPGVVTIIDRPRDPNGGDGTQSGLGSGFVISGTARSRRTRTS
jgi:hypothetical protein